MTEQTVLFPLAGAECGLASVTVNDLGTAGGGRHLVLGGPNLFNQGKEKEAEEIVKAVRYQEKEKPDLMDRRITVELHDIAGTRVEGESYGLALAIADYLSRHPEAAEGPVRGNTRLTRRVIATGKVEGAGGEINAVGLFGKKLEFIEVLLSQGDLKSGDLFFYPTDNEVGLGSTERELLERLVGTGLVCRGVEDFESVKVQFGSDKYTEANDSHGRPWSRLLLPVPPSSLSRARVVWLAIGLVASLATAAIVYQLLVDTDSLFDAPLVLALNQPCNDQDICIRFTSRGADGRRDLLTEQSRLASHERFAIHVSARRDSYLYILHFDAHRQFNELVGLARKHNRVRAGDTFVLPGRDRHYALDDRTGPEQFNILLSRTPLDELILQYNQLIAQAGGLGQPQAPALTKGLTTRLNAIPAIIEDGPGTAWVLHCRATSGPCRKSFLIDHISVAAGASNMGSKPGS